jgi:hypothetical protein
VNDRLDLTEVRPSDGHGETRTSFSPTREHWIGLTSAPMFAFISANEFRVFLDDTGKPFTAFMDSVLRPAATKLGCPPADVHTNLRTNLAKGDLSIAEVAPL